VCVWCVGDDGCFNPVSQLAVIEFVRQLVQLHNEGHFMSWTGAAVDTMLDWMLTDWDEDDDDEDDTQLQQV